MHVFMDNKIAYTNNENWELCFSINNYNGEGGGGLKKDDNFFLSLINRTINDSYHNCVIL